MTEKIKIDKALVGELMELTGLKTEQEVVDKALSEMVEGRRVQRKLLALHGKVKWDGNLGTMRRDR
jgi:Arc/MetJ family transcription regulator